MQSGDLKRELIVLLPRLRRFARTLAFNMPDADDLVQEACLRALERIETFTPGARLDSWMFSILRNAWYSELRRRTVRRGTGTVDAAQTGELVDFSDGPAHLAARELRDSVLGLPEGLASVVLLVSVEGYSYREAAEILDIPHGTVMSRVSRARRLIADGRDDVSRKVPA